MSQLGLGVMINMLAGNSRSVEAYKNAQGKVITKVAVVDDALVLHFADTTGIRFIDTGQSCCEHRYMTADDLDNPEYYQGATFEMANIKDADAVKGEYGDIHQVQFLEIVTSKGAFQVSNHNENNGYYCGFSIEVQPL